jgi:RHS repeat-associated protein
VIPITTAIKAVHITELRARLDEARAALGLSAANYTDPTLISGYQIKAAHVQELRTKTNEALTTGAGSSLDIRWLVADQLGTPRMIFDQSGDLTVLDQNGNYVRGVTRHDYLPFGEELFAGVGGRTSQQGYTVSDNVRQKFTGYERDSESGLDYAQARYYSNTQGRFSGPDGYNIFFEMNSGRDSKERDWIRRAYIWEPKNWNRYVYCINNPTNLFDPSGLIWVHDKEENLYIFVNDEDYKEGNQYYDKQNRYTAVTDGVDGVRFVLGELTGSADTPENRALIGQEVYLGAEGRIHAITYLNEQIGIGIFNLGMVTDFRGGTYFTLGFDVSWRTPPVSIARTEGTGPVNSGLSINGTVANGLAVTHSWDPLHPTDGLSREVGGGSPQVSVGPQLTIGPLKGSSPSDSLRNPGNHRTAVGGSAGRCVW